MEKILESADKVLVQIGRLALVRPLFFGILLISAVIVTWFGNQTWEPSVTTSQFATVDMPLVVPATSLPVIEPSVVLPEPNGPISPLATAPAVPKVKTPAVNPSPSSQGWQSITIKSGDTLTGLFKKHGLSVQQVAALSSLSGASALQRLKLGQELRIYKNADGQLQQLVYSVSDKTALKVLRSGNAYTATTATVPLAATSLASSGLNTAVPVKPEKNTLRTANPAVASASALHYVSGRITRSLSVDARKAGLSAQQAGQLVQLFSHKGLAQNTRRGDEFSVLYESPVKRAEKKGGANIMAAQLTTRDKTYQLVRFVDPQGRADYYNSQGESLRDALVREPLHYTRISSLFSANRFDPVLGYNHPHTGVDFSAPLGTPIQAAGNGVLAEMHYKGGYGKAIVIKHDGAYSTLYAHLSRFASNLREGAPVKKGQLIGYVGQTGFATGPHLHFEIRVNDVPANPLTVALPTIKIPKAYRSQFFLQTRTVLAQLHANQQVRLAQRTDLMKRS